MSEKGFRVEIPVSIKRDRWAPNIARQELPRNKETDDVPRLARLLALAHKWKGMVERGEVESYAEIARTTRITRTGVGHICALALLAPDLQEQVLNANVDELKTARQLRVLARDPIWAVQRHVWPQRVKP